MFRTFHCELCDAPAERPRNPHEEALCSDCADNIAERGWERFCEDFHGGNQPFTLREQQEAARKLK